MMRILIVDDETPSRKQIKSELIDLGYDENYIEEASNGIMALEIAKEFSPNILLTDISMPKMLGTELAQKILEGFPDCKVIFFSGYSDKVYLKAAIKLKVVDYLEKPLDSSEFAATMKKAEAEISKDKHSHSDDDNSEFIDCLFKNKQLNTSENNDLYKKILNSLWFVCAIIVPCNEYKTSITNLLTESSTNHSLNYIYRYKSNGAIEILFYGNSATEKQDIDKVFRHFLSNINEDEIFKCAIGNFEKNSKNIYLSYENAVFAYDNAFFHKPNTVIKFLEPEKIASPNSDEIAKNLYQALEEENYDKARSVVNNLYKNLYKSNFIMSSTAKKIYYNLFETVHTFFRNYSFASSGENTLYENTFNIHKANFLFDLNENIISLLNRAEQLMSNTDFNSIVKSALHYMKKNYSNPNLSIITIAQHCNVNANYLCGIFKSIMGETINHHINNLRIETAKKLILETNLKIADISSQCGFNDAKYFCRVFGKYTKTTPTNFRKKYK